MRVATKNMHGRRDATMILVCYRHGLRVSELVGLEWGDLDFNGRFLDVRRSLQDGGRVELPKNKRIRRVDMSLQLAEELQRLKVARAKEALARGALAEGLVTPSGS